MLNKLEHSFMPRAGVCTYVREDICSQRLSSLEGKDLSILWLRIDNHEHLHIYACLYIDARPIAVTKLTD